MTVYIALSLILLFIRRRHRKIVIMKIAFIIVVVIIIVIIIIIKSAQIIIILSSSSPFISSSSPWSALLSVKFSLLWQGLNINLWLRIGGNFARGKFQSTALWMASNVYPYLYHLNLICKHDPHIEEGRKCCRHDSSKHWLFHSSPSVWLSTISYFVSVCSWYVCLYT